LANNGTNKDQFSTRIDFVESSRSNWFGRFSWDDEFNIAPALVLNGSSLQTHVDQWMIDNVRVLKPNLVNEFRFGFNHFFNSLASQLSGARDVVKELGIPGLAGSRDIWQRWPGRSDRSRCHRLEFSTLRSFNFTEKRYLQFRFEAFNLPNHPNWGNPGVVLGDNRLDAASKPIPGSGRFAAITSTRTAMRQLQFSLKMVF